MTHSFTPEEKQRANALYDQNHAAMHLLNAAIEEMQAALNAGGPVTMSMLQRACAGRALCEYVVRGAVAEIEAGLLPDNDLTIVPPAPMPDINEAGGK